MGLVVLASYPQHVATRQHGARLLQVSPVGGVDWFGI